MILRGKEEGRPQKAYQAQANRQYPTSSTPPKETQKRGSSEATAGTPEQESSAGGKKDRTERESISENLHHNKHLERRERKGEEDLVQTNSLLGTV